jgi:hypothetical protein
MKPWASASSRRTHLARLIEHWLGEQVALRLLISPNQDDPHQEMHPMLKTWHDRLFEVGKQCQQAALSTSVACEFYDCRNDSHMKPEKYIVWDFAMIAQYCLRRIKNHSNLQYTSLSGIAETSVSPHVVLQVSHPSKRTASTRIRNTQTNNGGLYSLYQISRADHTSCTVLPYTWYPRLCSANRESVRFRKYVQTVIQSVNPSLNMQKHESADFDEQYFSKQCWNIIPSVLYNSWCNDAAPWRWSI